MKIIPLSKEREKILLLDEKINGNSRMYFNVVISRMSRKDIKSELKKKLLLLKLLTKLRAVVMMRNEVFESKLSDNLVFENFYPQERGPLPTDKEICLEEGLSINVPYSAIESILMKFVLVREEHPQDKTAINK